MCPIESYTKFKAELIITSGWKLFVLVKKLLRVLINNTTDYRY